MAKPRKRRQPVTSTNIQRSQNTLTGHNLIRRFHILLKRRERLATGSSSTSLELIDIEKEITELGGLETYQRISAQGQSEDRGGGSHKVFIGWILEQDLKKEWEGKQNRFRLLEVGALKHDNYASHASWMDYMPIDLRSRHPLIHEQNFLTMDEHVHRGQWDAVSLSLVLNFVSNPHDRGKMLALAHEFLRDDGYLFLALPLPCVANSRYLDFDQLKNIMSVLGFALLKERWKGGGKMAYWLYQKISGISTCTDETRKLFAKKAVLKGGGGRNNFVILL